MNAVTVAQNKNPYPPHHPSVAYFPTESDWRMMREIGNQALRSGMLPAEIKSPEAAAIIALKARELGMPVMVGFAHIHVIKGKPTLSAEMMQALARRNLPGLVINIVESTNDKASVEFIRPEPGSKPFKITFTLEDAKKAEITNNPSWKKYPAAMLWSRAVSSGLRKVCPEALMGVSYTPEEMGAHVDESGHVIPTTGREIPEDSSSPPAGPKPIPKPSPEEIEHNQTIRNTLFVITSLMKELQIDNQTAQQVLQDDCGATSLKTATLDQLNKFHHILMKEKEAVSAAPNAPEIPNDEQGKLAPWEADMMK